MKKAFAIWTPLHLLNTLQYILSRNEESEHDAYFIIQSESMRKYVDIVKKENIFSAVYTTTREKQNKNQKLWEWYSALISPKQYIRHLFGAGAVNHSYAQFFFSVPTRVNDALVQSNHCDEVIGLDDGIGSYMGDIFGFSLGKRYNALRRLRTKDTYQVEQLYLNEPRFYDGKRSLQLQSIKAKDLTEDQKKLIRKIFSYDDSMSYEETDIVFLNQPIVDYPDAESHRNTEVKIIEAIKNTNAFKTVVRLHPREKESAIYSGMEIDKNSNMWELICEKEFDESICLVSCFSTAQMTPKLLFDKEPYALITYQLYEDITDPLKTNITGMVNNLGKIYRSPDKIMVPQSFDELEDMLKTLAKRNEQ